MKTNGSSESSYQSNCNLDEEKFVLKFGFLICRGGKLKREVRDKKFGFGGRKSGSKKNNFKNSEDDGRGRSGAGGGGGPGGRKQKSKPNARPGKSKRQTAKSAGKGGKGGSRKR